MSCNPFLRTAAAVCAVALFTLRGTAQSGQVTGQDGAINTAVSFLLINPDARAGALGDAGVANPNGANGQFFNPAMLAFEQGQSGVAFNYTPWLRFLIPDINLFYLPGYYNLGGNNGVLMGALTYFRLGEINFTDVAGIPQGTYTANELALQFGYARKLSEFTSLAVTLKYIRSDLTGSQSLGGIPFQPAQSVAGDIGFYYRKPVSDKVVLNLGASITNIGSKVRYVEDDSTNSFIPTNLRLGTTVNLRIDEYNEVNFLLDFQKLMVPSEGGTSDQSLLSGMFGSFSDAEGGFSEELSEVATSVGVEYWYNKLFAARVGYFYESPNKGDRNYVTLGAGAKYQDLRFDFAFLVPLQENNPLQNTLRFSIGYDIASK
ncbi:MAG: type IX secretion system outer membrane channel protein PorV [Bacteroidia bacterium]|nr:type IX secretion system outer membrane channel protein PorV [Bacteroidia bacterium]